MLPEETHINYIREAFGKMRTKDDLVNLLNHAKPLVYGENAVPFELKQLTWYTNPKINRKRYTEFKIKKKSGGERLIHSPVPGLKAIQKTLGFILQCIFEPHKGAMGFVPGVSIVDNAKIHEGSNYVYNIDLKDFFPSIDQARVWKCLQLKPFYLVENKKNKFHGTSGFLAGNGSFTTAHNETIYYNITEDRRSFVLNKNRGDYFRYEKRILTEKSSEIALPTGVSDNTKERLVLFADAAKYVVKKDFEKKSTSSRLDLANIIACLCCTEIDVERKNSVGEWEKVKRSVLPQGAPTSPVITNVICQRLDYLLSAVAKRFNLKYSRYADDITFSSMHNVYQQEGDFLKELQRIISEQGFHIKESKTRLQKDGYRKEVTGLLVNDKANVQLRYIKQLRSWLYYWERYGYDRAYGFFQQQYVADKGNMKKGNPDMANVIAGKLDYLKMVKGNENAMYLKLKARFDNLAGNVNPINEILDVWEKKGIEKAMGVYYDNNNLSIYDKG